MKISTCDHLIAVGLSIVTLVLPAMITEAGAQQIDFTHPAYSAIERERSFGREHVNGPVDYEAEFPTSGSHSPTPAQPGFYESDLPDEAIVHSLEHGNVVIYYDEPGELALKMLRRWTQAYQGALDGVVAVRRQGMGEKVVLTAWQHRLVLEQFDVRATHFVDAFRGRGPERIVR